MININGYTSRRFPGKLYYLFFYQNQCCTLKNTFLFWIFFINGGVHFILSSAISQVFLFCFEVDSTSKGKINFDEDHQYNHGLTIDNDNVTNSSRENDSVCIPHHQLFRQIYLKCVKKKN